MKVLAIDPGVTTGIAVRHFSGELRTTTMKDAGSIFKLVADAETVVCEDFTTSGNISTYGLYTVRLIGGIQALCWLHNKNLCMQMPQHRAAFVAEARTLLRGTKHVVHEVDALAHLLRFESSKGANTNWRTIEQLMLNQNR